LSTQYKIGDIINVSVKKIVPRGYGIAFVEKLTVFVPLSVPGDDLTVRIREIKKRTAFAEIVEVKSGGPRRIDAPCEYFGRCGGCDFQQLTYRAQLDAKLGIIRDCLHRIAKIATDIDIRMIPSPKEFGYRSRARWHIDRERKSMGFYARDSHNVVDILSCPILTPGLQSSLDYLRESMDWESVFDDRTEIEAATGDDGRVSIYSTGEESAALSFSLDGDVYNFSAESFFQANKFVVGELIKAAIEGASGETAFDLYSGVGLFALPLARQFGSVLAVEGNAGSANFAEQNIANAGLKNVEVVRQNVRYFLRETARPRPDLVLIDPPRSGTEIEVITAIARLASSQISYVSCEPSILARDLRILIDAGYAINSITALDMFPQTHHVETVVRLSKA